MKHKPIPAALTAAVLAFITAWGTVGCLTTAFSLNLENPAGLPLTCVLASLLWAALLSIRYGGSILLCLLALAAGYIYEDGTAAGQFVQLIFRLSSIYDRAYGWGIPLSSDLPWDEGFADWPLGILGSLIAIAVVWSVLRQHSVWFPVLATILPLCSCIVVTDTVPDEIWLMMVMAGLILLLLTAYVRQENAAQGIRLLQTAALPVILALVALFQFTPQEDYVNHSGVFRENIIIAAENVPRLLETGLEQIASGLQKQPAKQVDLAGLGSRIPFTYPVMEVTAEVSGSLYLRGQDYDVYNGLGWTASEGRSEAFPSAAGAGEIIRIETKNQKSIRYFPYHPAFQTTLQNGSVKNADLEQQYTIERTRLPDDWRQIAYQNTANAPEEWQNYLSLPESTRQGVLPFLDGLYLKTASNTEKADVIAALVTSSAKYDLDPEKMPSGEPDFALWFLQEGDRGYCVHFATAATVLLRTADVPARYVTGYLVEAAAGEPVTVTEEDAHAWAEYYEPNLGLWLPLEATPADETPVPSVLPRPALPQTAQPAETTQPEETQPETQDAVTDAPIPTESTTAATEPVLPEIAPEEEQNPRPLPLGLLSIPLLFMTMILQRRLRLTLRRRKQRTGTTNAQTLQRWQETIRLTRLLKEKPPEDLFRLAQKAKFSQHLLTDEELAHFDRFNSGCLEEIRKKPWYLRLICQYVYAAY